MPVVNMCSQPGSRLRFGLEHGASLYNGPVTTRSFNLDLVHERFPARDAVMHVSFGSGLSLSSTFEVNGAADISSQSRIISISAIVRFGK